MASSRNLFQKIDDYNYNELYVSDDGTKSFEWRRSFNPIHLDLKDISIINNLSIHDSEWDLRNEHQEKPWKLIVPNNVTSKSIHAIVDKEILRDTIYCLKNSEGDENTFLLEVPPDEIQVTLMPGQPTKEDENYPENIFYGICFRMDNVDPDKDYLCFELTIPQDYLDKLIASLEKNPNLNLAISVILLSFSNRADDSFREWYSPRDLFIEDSAPCPVSSITTMVPFPDKPDKPERSAQDSSWVDHFLNKERAGEDLSDDTINETPSTTREMEIATNLLALTKSVKMINIALWILAIIVVISVIF